MSKVDDLVRTTEFQSEVREWEKGGGSARKFADKWLQNGAGAGEGKTTIREAYTRVLNMQEEENFPQSATNRVHPAEPFTGAMEVLPAILQEQTSLMVVEKRSFKDRDEAWQAAQTIVKGIRACEWGLFEWFNRKGDVALGYTGEPDSLGTWIDCIREVFASQMTIGARAIRYVHQAHTVYDNFSFLIERGQKGMTMDDLERFSPSAFREFAQLERPEDQFQAGVVALLRTKPTKNGKARATAETVRQIVKEMRRPSLTAKAQRAEPNGGASTATSATFLDVAAKQVEVARLNLTGEPYYSEADECWNFNAEDEAGLPYLLVVPAAELRRVMERGG